MTMVMTVGAAGAVRAMRGARQTAYTRRRFVAAQAAAGGVAALVGAACGTGQPAQSPALAAKPSDVSLYVYNFSARQQDLFDSVVKAPFEKENPGFTLDYTVGGGLAKLITLTTSGETPDVTWWGAPETWMKGLLRRLNDLIARDKVDTKVFPQTAFKSWQVVRDNVVSLPVQAGGNWPVLPYNKDMFARAGVPEPPQKWNDPKWTWDAFVDACKRIQASLEREGGASKRWAIGFPTGGDYYAQAHPYLWKTSWVSADWKQATPDSQSMIDSIKACADLVLRTQAAPKPGEAQGNSQALFLNGTTAMMQGSAVFLAPVAEAADKGAPFALAPLPIMKQVGSSINLDGLGLLKEGKHPDAGWVLSKWMASNPRWCIARGTPPARADFFDAWAKDYLGSVAPSIHLEVYREAYAFALAMDPVNMQPRTDEIKSTVLTPALNQVFKGERSAEDALRSMKAPLQAMLQAMS